MVDEVVDGGFNDTIGLKYGDGEGVGCGSAVGSRDLDDLMWMLLPG